MKRLLYFIMGILLTACSYDEVLDTYSLSVQLVYPEDSIDPYAGARVELKDATASIFVAETDSIGVAHFIVPPGLYEASTSSQFTDSTGSTWWRYIFNGVQSQIIVSPADDNKAQIDLLMSKKRIVH